MVHLLCVLLNACPRTQSTRRESESRNQSSLLEIHRTLNAHSQLALITSSSKPPQPPRWSIQSDELDKWRYTEARLRISCYTGPFGRDIELFKV